MNAATPTTRAELAGFLDHSLLAPEATAEQVTALCEVAAAEHVASVCVSPTFVALAAKRLAGTGVGVSAVIGFPSGAHAANVKATEITGACADGATELDVVVNLGPVHDHNWGALRLELSVIRKAAGETPIKLIIESATLTNEQIAAVCELALVEHIDTIKTSTGFHPAGGATVNAVELIADLVSGYGVGVKAAGGIRTTADALAMIEAGATRIGCSATVTILDGMPDN